MSDLSPEELKELQELEELEALESREASNSEVAEPLDDRGVVEKAATGFVGGVLEGAGEIVGAAVETGQSALIAATLASQDVLTTEQAQDFVAGEYNKNKKDISDSVDKMKSANPTTALIGDIASTTAGFAVTSGGMAGKAAVEFAQGAFSGATRSEADAFSKEHFVDMMSGGTISLLAPKVIRGAGQVIKGTAKGLGVDKAFAGLTKSSKKIALGAKTKTSQKKLEKFLSATGQDEDAFINQMIRSKGTDNKSLLRAGSTIDDMISSTSNHANKSYNKMISKIESSDINISPERAKVRVEGLLKKIIAESPEDAARLQKGLMDITHTKAIFNNSTGVQTTYDTFNKSIKLSAVVNHLDDLKNTYSKVTGIDSQVGNIIGDLVDSVKIVSKDGSSKQLAGISKSLKSYRNSSMTNELLSERSKELANPAVTAIRDAIGLKGVAAILHPQSIPLIAASVGATAIAKNSRVPLAVAKSLDTMGKMQMKYPNHPIWTQLASATAVNIDTFRNTLSGVMAKASFLQSPLPRTLEGVKANKENVIGMIRQEFGDSEADALSNALQHGKDKDVAAMMSNMLKDAPAEVDQYIEEGVGFEGKVYSPEEKAFFKNEINITDAPLSWKLKAAKELRENGTIPTSPQESIMLEQQLRMESKKRSFVESKSQPRY
jgi:hypothetical protein